MCRSQAEGGQRCAAHTRPRYEAATFGTAEWDAAATEYASTPEGKARLAETLAEVDQAGDITRSVALERALRAGDTLRAANDEARGRLAAAADWQPGTPHPVGGYDQRHRDEHGSVAYTRNGRLHRLDGPAIEDEDGVGEYFCEGEPYCKLQCLRPQTRPADCEYAGT